MKFMYFSIKYRYKNINLIYNRLYCCNRTCYCVYLVYVMSAARYITSALRYHPRYQSRSSMYILGLIPGTFTELAEAVPIALLDVDKFKTNFFARKLSCLTNCKILFGLQHLDSKMSFK